MKTNYLLVRSIHEERKKRMEENISNLFEELDKEKSEIPMMNFSQRRSVKIEQFVERIRKYDTVSNQMLSKTVSLKEKIVEITEEHKIAMSPNAKTMNTFVKIHEKALDDKTNELAYIKLDLQSVNVTNQELLQKIQEFEPNNNIFVDNVCLERNDEVKPFSCKYCDESFVQVHEVREHVKIHESVLEGEHDTTIETTLEVHEKIAFPCSNCNQEFTSENMRDKHEGTCKQKSDSLENQNTEVENEQESSIMPNIAQNSQNVHNSQPLQEIENSFVCDICKKGLIVHLKIHGSQFRIFKCPHEPCKKSFYVKHALNSHLNIHTGSKPHKYRRNYKKGFNDRSTRNQHEKTCKQFLKSQ